MPPPTLFTFPPSSAAQLEPYLPPQSTSHAPSTTANPFVTLTYASSLDSAITLTPGRSTPISGPESLAMTHFLRSRHDAILVGIGTFLADDPSLSCRHAAAAAAAEGRSQRHRIRPVVVDPSRRWDLGLGAKAMRLAERGEGLAPWVVTSRDDGHSDSGCHSHSHGDSRGYPPEARAAFEKLGGRVLEVQSRQVDGRKTFSWPRVFRRLAEEGIASVMVEGGGAVIAGLLGEEGRGCVDSVVVTIAPKWLGEGSLFVRPGRGHGADGEAAAALETEDVAWLPMGRDVVLCARIGANAGRAGRGEGEGAEGAVM